MREKYAGQLSDKFPQKDSNWLDGCKVIICLLLKHT